ncbi:MAG: VOC family protein [Ruminiclostridium sp.]
MNNINILGLNHFAINTRDFKQSLEFYRDILGFKQLETVKTEQSSSTNLVGPGGSVIELIDMYEKPIEIPGSDDDIGVAHIAFDVVDVAAHEKDLRNLNIEIILTCTDLKEFNTRVLKFKDPNGIQIAFRENIM